MKEPVMSRISGTATALVLGIVAVSQPSSGTAEVGKAERELMQLERAWSAAYLKHDTATIGRLLADEYVGIDGRGIVTNKSEEIQQAQAPEPGTAAPPFVVVDESVTDMNVRSYGHMAVV